MTTFRQLRNRADPTSSVEVFHWNPTWPRFQGPLRRLPVKRPVNNFGDLLGPVIVEWVHNRLGLSRRGARPARLLSVGSVLSFARDGDTIWGTGVNGKNAPEDHAFTSLDVRAVRGPLTHDFLRTRGLAEHELPYGDPALLLGHVRPDLVGLDRRFPVTVIPNLNEPEGTGVPHAVSPCRPLEAILQRIATSKLVVGSSLHAIVVAESLGIPARAVRSAVEPEFKYADYYRGTGRDEFSIAGSAAEAVEAGGMEPPRWSPEPLLDAFPRDLWRAPAGG